jgi:peptide/nickel transport system permease protein
MTGALRTTLRRLNPLLVVGGVLLLVVVAIAFLAGVIYPDDPFDMVGAPFRPPLSEGFPLGTDSLGRDIAAGVVHGARISLIIGITTAVLSTLVGVMVGAAAGYFGGRIDTLLMRTTELFQTIPSFLFAIVVLAVLQPTLYTVIFAIVVVSWAPLARLVRGEVASLRNREFVSGCVALGMSDLQIIVRQILPNALPSIVVAASVAVASAILFESGLSFLGLGDPNVMSWGLMIGMGRSVIRTAWWVSAVPGVAVLLTVLAINLLGDGLNEALNPRAAGGDARR